jgi:hypothetical protein
MGRHALRIRGKRGAAGRIRAGVPNGSLAHTGAGQTQPFG